MKYFSFKNVIIASLVLIVGACTKETSYESGANLYGPAIGSLKDSVGNCQGIIVSGTYKADTALNDNNFILVKVNITTPGQFLIASDTANGFWFRDSGYVTAGLQTVKIRGYGKPILPLNTDFVLTYNNSACLFTVLLIAPPPPVPIIRDYFPTTIGSNWAYNVAGFTDSLHVDASPKDTIIGGDTYRVFYGFRGTVKDTGFYRKTGGDYYRFDALDVNTGRLPLLFLKENQPILTQWDSQLASTTFNGLPTQVRMHYTLMGVNTSRTVNGNVFDSVIQVKNELQYQVVGTFQTIQTINTYFAKSVGLIEFEIPGLYSQTITRWRVY